MEGVGGGGGGGLDFTFFGLPRLAGTGAFTSFGCLRLRETVAFGSVAGVDLSFFGCAGALNF